MTSRDEALVRAMALPIAERYGVDVDEVSVRTRGHSSVVRVIVDSDGGVDLEATARLSRELSDALDAASTEVLSGGKYTLGVTSPGVDRPLTAPNHFRRAVGRMATFTLVGGERVRARILRSADGVTVLTGADGCEHRVLAFDDIVSAVVEVEFSPPSAAVQAVLAQAGITEWGAGGVTSGGEEAR